MKKSMKAGSLLLAAGVLLASTSALQAQSPDGRWLPFVGCWEAIGAEADSGLLCVEPANGGVQLSNIVNGEVVSTEQLLADGQQRPVNAEGCEGWEAVEFSVDGRRAFTRTEFDCGTDRPRTGTGIMAFTAPNMWVDVRALDVDGEPVSWMQEYLLVGVDRLAEEGVTDPAAELSFAVRSARMAAAAPIDLSDVEEGAAVVDARAVETWIVAQRDRLDPSAQDLLRLSEAGVAENVIDAVVAVSFPDDFLVESDGLIEETALAPRPAGYRGYMGYNRGWASAWGMPYSYGYGYGYGAGYGYGRYGYSPFGYSPYGYGGYGYGYWGSRPGTVIIDRRDRGDSGSVTRNGYRRIGGASTGTARPRSGARPSYGTGGSRSGAAAGSSGGSRSGGRTAQPRRRSGGERTPSAAASSGSSRPTAPRRTARPRRRTGG